jgi:SHS2 domain-containing protein
MERYRILDHAGDGKIRAFGATIEEAFGNAALAVVSLMTDGEKVERRVERRVAVEGRDLGQLLIKFLNEILYALDARGFVLSVVADLEIELPDTCSVPVFDPLRGDADGTKPASDVRSLFRLAARFLGDDRTARYEFHGDVKAVTHNETKIEQCACGPGPWMVQVVVDL